jgi:Region found in RelA / SpoT proteins
MLGLRVIVSEREQEKDTEKGASAGRYSVDVSDDAAASAISTDSDSDSEADHYARMNDENEAAVWRVYNIISSALSSHLSDFDVSSASTSTSDGAVTVDAGIGEWEEVKSRFKDYVTQPKPSGYQSLHMTLLHRPTGIEMEIQIRSQRMHRDAEYGAAAHSKYKALVLPAAVAAPGGERDADKSND